MHISKPLALVLARAIVDGAEHEILSRQLLPNECLAVRGAALRALDNLWYDVLPVRTRELFSKHGAMFASHDAFIDAVWRKHSINAIPA